jgi:peptidoglycan-N-acetylglucosamine deacetylase
VPSDSCRRLFARNEMELCRGHVWRADLAWSGKVFRGGRVTIRDYLVLAVVWMGLTASAAAQSVSFTFDDGPTLAPTPLMTPAERNEALLAHLRVKQVQAMFFVTLGNGADRPEGLAMLERLSDGDQLIANHTVTHPDFNSDATSLDAFAQEIVTCDDVVGRLPGYRKLLRFPYLREGADVSKRDGIRRFLREHGYRIGYVSIDTSDWLLDQKLRRALVSNPALDLTAWRDLHLAGLWDNAQAYERLARQLYGREVAHVLLLHHNLTNALFLGDVIDMFRARGWKIVSPDEAFEDAAYNVAPMLPKLNGSVLETTAQALGVPSRPALAGIRSERHVGEDADRLAARH